MRLLIEWSDITAVVASARTQLDGRTLEIDLEALRGLLESDARLERVRIDLAHPGESCRIGRVFDVFAPRAKDDGDEDFPGLRRRPRARRLRSDARAGQRRGGGHRPAARQRHHARR